MFVLFLFICCHLSMAARVAAILFLLTRMLAELLPFFDILLQKTARNPLRNRGSCTKIVSKVQTICTLHFQST